MEETEEETETIQDELKRTSRISVEGKVFKLLVEEEDSFDNLDTERVKQIKEENQQDLAHQVQVEKMLSENKLILEKLKDQNSKLERMFLYLRECNIVGLGYNKENYMKRKSKILNSRVKKVVSVNPP